MSNFNVSKDNLDKIGDGETFSNGVELPFPAPVIYVINGDPSRKKDGGAQYFGGWSTDRDTIDEMVAAKEILAPPSYLKPGELYTSNGLELPVYTSRYIIASPVEVRTSWLAYDGQRFPKYQKGTRQHTQILAILGAKYQGAEEISAWGPVILSAKGFQARNIVNAFSAWIKVSKSARAEYADNLPAWLFYTYLGTFGGQREVEMVGKTSQSPMTPIKPFYPQLIDEGTLTNVFGGDELSDMMANIKEQSQEWAVAWMETSHDELYNKEEKQENNYFQEDGVYNEDGDDGIPW